jgi:hypothetical protein
MLHRLAEGRDESIIVGVEPLKPLREMMPLKEASVVSAYSVETVIQRPKKSSDENG